MRPDSRHKADRLNLITALLWKRPGGLTTRALAQELGVTTRTIQRDLADLQADAYRLPLTRNGDRWILETRNRTLLSSLRLTLPEATALGLAARLLQRASDETNPHVSAALAKLADVLPGPLEEHLQTLLAIGTAGAIPGFAGIFETLAHAWANRRTTRIEYQRANSDQAIETDFDVYCLEPLAPGFAIYAIGFSHVRAAIRTFKLERIRRASLTDRAFEVRPDFDARSYLFSGWGIMGGPDRQTVRLRFAPSATRRIRESRFHDSQQVEDLPDGGCLVTFRIAGVIEVVPFIRGWGQQVEVLEPASLRHQVAADARATADRYERSADPDRSNGNGPAGPPD